MQYSPIPSEHTLSPIVTGSTVIGIKYDGGVLVAADTLASYGSQARYKDVCRMKTVGKYTLLGSSGEMSDFQYLSNNLDELDMEDFLNEDGCSMGPEEYSSYIARVMYNRRTKGNPLFNQFVIVGRKDKKSFLSFVDHQATYFEEDYIATGFGSYLAMPLMRNEWKPTITKAEAMTLVKKCLQVCFYRDCKAYYKIHVGDCSDTGVTISEPLALEHNWSHPDWLEKRLEPGANAGTADTW